MKQLMKLLVASAVCGMGFVGCGLLDPTDETTPTITIDNIPDIDVGTKKNVTGKVTAGEAITSISYSIENSSGTKVTTITALGPSSTNEKTLEFKNNDAIEVTATSGAVAGDYKLVISVTAGTTVEAKFDFKVKGMAAMTLTAKSGTIANVMGPDTGAYDLVNGKRIPSSGSASNKDLLDLSLVGAGFAGEIGTDNGAMFATATAADYDNATDVSVKALAADAAADKISISNGTVFVVKLGSSRGYAIVKITRYDATAGASSGDNKGEADFSYKFTAD